MKSIILLVAVLLLTTGVFILVKPMIVFGVMGAYSKSIKLQIFAVVFRLLLGVVLLASAHNSKFPLTFEVIGWLSIVAALVFSLIGRNKFMKLIEWAMTLVPRYGRFSGLFAILFGGFLGYAVF